AAGPPRGAATARGARASGRHGGRPAGRGAVRPAASARRRPPRAQQSHDHNGGDFSGGPLGGEPADLGMNTSAVVVADSAAWGAHIDQNPRQPGICILAWVKQSPGVRPRRGRACLLSPEGLDLPSRIISARNTFIETLDASGTLDASCELDPTPPPGLILERSLTWPTRRSSGAEADRDGSERGSENSEDGGPRRRAPPEGRRRVPAGAVLARGADRVILAAGLAA
ncbi:unnamed protein product, partial [Prorocentrum cordatum]